MCMKYTVDGGFRYLLKTIKKIKFFSVWLKYSYINFFLKEDYHV